MVHTKKNNRVKFSTQIDADLLAELKDLARSQGRQIQFMVEEAVEQFVHAESEAQMRPEIRKAYNRCIERYGPVLEKLAK